MEEPKLESLLREGLGFPVPQTPLASIRARADRSARRRLRVVRSTAFGLIAGVALTYLAVHGVASNVVPQSSGVVVATPAPLPAPSPELT